MELITIVYVSDMVRSFDFYQTLGFRGESRPKSAPIWLPLQLQGARLALHWVEELPQGGQVGIALLADDLDAVAERLRAVGIELRRGIQQEPFGRSLLISDPDGLLIQINEHN